jgi:hypothetical protein
VINLKREIKRELELIEPPDLWAMIQEYARADSAVAGLPDRRRPPAALWVALAAVTLLLALVASSLPRNEVQTVDTRPAAEPPQVGGDPDSDEGASSVDVQISSCRGGSGIVTAGFEVTKRSSLRLLNDPSDYIVRIKVVDEAGPIGVAAAVVRNVYPNNPKEAEAVAPIADTSPAGPVVTNCFLEDVQRVAGT